MACFSAVTWKKPAHVEMLSKLLVFVLGVLVGNPVIQRDMLKPFFPHRTPLKLFTLIFKCPEFKASTFLLQSMAHTSIFISLCLFAILISQIPLVNAPYNSGMLM